MIKAAQQLALNATQGQKADPGIWPKLDQQIHIALRSEVCTDCRTEQFQAANAIAPAVPRKLSLRQFEILEYHPGLRAAHRATPIRKKGYHASETMGV